MVLYSLDPSNEFNQVEIESGEIEINKIDINNPGKIEIYEFGDDGKVLLSNSNLEILTKWREEMDVTVCLKSRHSDSKILLETIKLSKLSSLGALLNDNLKNHDLNFNSLKTKQYDIEISVTNQEPWLIELDYKSKINAWDMIDFCANWAENEWDGSVEQLRKNDELNFLLVFRLKDRFDKAFINGIYQLNNGFGDVWVSREGFLTILKDSNLDKAGDILRKGDLQYGEQAKSYLPKIVKEITDKYGLMKNSHPHNTTKSIKYVSYHVKYHKYQISLLERLEKITGASFVTLLNKLGCNLHSLQNSSMSPAEYIGYLEKLSDLIPTHNTHYYLKNKKNLIAKIKYEILQIRSEQRLKPTDHHEKKQARKKENTGQTTKINQPTPSQSSSEPKPLKPRSNPTPRKSLATSVPKIDKKRKKQIPQPTRGGRKKHKKSISTTLDSSNEEKVPGSIESQFRNMKKEHDNGGKKETTNG